MTNNEELGLALSQKLSEPKTELITGVVDLIGSALSVELFDRTREIESKGGMMIKNGERRRTPGGVFLQLLRDDDRVDKAKVRRFFAQSQQPQKGKNGNKKNKNFNQELELFKKLSQEHKKKVRDEQEERHQREEEMMEEVKPLPDLIVETTKKVTERSLSNASSSGCSAQFADVLGRNPDSFVEPEAPPNSVERVERTISSYDDDDFLNHEGETEDIELF